MARMYPDKITDQKTPRSERKVFDALRMLSDEWLVLHSVAWQGIRNGREGDGEADFVVAHPTKGAFVVEVKGGGVQLTSGQWKSIDRKGVEHSIKNPFTQVSDSKHFLGQFLAERIPRIGNKVHMGHAVWFPDIEMSGNLGPEANDLIVLDRTDLPDPSESVARLAGHWNATTGFDDHQFAELRKSLAPTRRVRRLLRFEVEDRREELLELTERQIKGLGLLRKQRRAMIVGGAGTGKTLMASERARQLADDGHRVLLVCFNVPLGRKLEEDHKTFDNITAGNFHRIARRIVDEAGDLPRDDHGHDFLNEMLPELLPSSAEKLDLSFDAIIIDEGQDFRPNWWTALQLILSDPDDGFLHVFADSQQDLYGAGWEPPFDEPPFPLDTNCRNTTEIANRVGAIFGREERSLGISGPAPIFIEIAGRTQAPKKLENVLTKLLDEADLDPAQITVLSTDRRFVEGIRFETVGEYKMVEPGKEYGIAVETVHRFKGLENDAIVLVIPELDEDRGRALAYVGMSRARVLLYVIGTAAVRDYLSWA